MIVNVCTCGAFDYADSYGLIASRIATHLAGKGHHVNAYALLGAQVGNQEPAVRAITQAPRIPSFGGLFLGYPTGYHQHGAPFAAGPRVAVTMFESTKLPADWIEPLNDMDAVIVPSEFCRTVFRDSGVNVPLHVVPLGIGETYQYRPRERGKPLTFLAFFDRGERKGGFVALQAFLRAFGEDMNYRLILKHRNAKVPFTLTNPNIEVIHADMTEAELYDLYCRCDVLINPHKGEGFGLIPREFAASGGLALTTGWSGTADHISEWGCALPYALEPAHWRGNKTLEGQELGYWAALDPAEVAHHLKMVAATWDFTRILLPAKAQAARSLYSWERFAQNVLEIWEGVALGNREPASKIAA